MLHKTRGSDGAGEGAFPELGRGCPPRGPPSVAGSWVELGSETSQLASLGTRLGWGTGPFPPFLTGLVDLWGVGRKIK